MGKPLGILLFYDRRPGRCTPSSGPAHRDLLTVGIAASIGFTVSLFFATAAFSKGAALAETKMGALLSFVAAPLALAGRLAGVYANAGRVMTSRLEVLIVGAGPIGLTLACHLGV